MSLVFLCFQSYANNDSQRKKDIYNPLIENLSVNQNKGFKLLSELKFDTIENHSIVISKNKKMYDCEITIKGDFDGNKVDVVVTISDVSWVGCQTIKAVVKALLATM